MAPDTGTLVAEILNAAWAVRHYAPQRGSQGRLRRSQAILKLGLVVRDAFDHSDDFEALLAAVVDGLRPVDRPPF